MDQQHYHVPDEASLKLAFREIALTLPVLLTEMARAGSTATALFGARFADRIASELILPEDAAVKVFAAAFVTFGEFLLLGCAESDSAAKAQLRFSVVEAFYHDSFGGAPQPNVVAAGTVRDGEVRIGDDVVVRHSGGEDVVRVLAILGDDTPLELATAGEAAGLRLKVASADLYRRWSAGDESGFEIVGNVRR